MFLFELIAWSWSYLCTLWRTSSVPAKRLCSPLINRALSDRSSSTTTSFTPFLSQTPGKEYSLLGSFLPVSSQIITVHKYVAFFPVLHVEVSISHFIQSKVVSEKFRVLSLLRHVFPIEYFVIDWDGENTPFETLCLQCDFWWIQRLLCFLRYKFRTKTDDSFEIWWHLFSEINVPHGLN